MTNFMPTTVTHRLGEIQRVFVPNAEISGYADLVGDKLIRKGRDGYLAWTRKASVLMATAHREAEARAYPIR